MPISFLQFYNTDYIQEEITSWSALWDDRYSGKILMFDNPRDSFAIAQFMLGQSLNTCDDNDWAEAAALLKQQKPMVQALRRFFLLYTRIAMYTPKKPRIIAISTADSPGPPIFASAHRRSTSLLVSSGD